METGTDSVSIPEHFFICGICQNTLRSPKQLGCLHSFCSKCVEKYVDGDQRTGNSSGEGQVGCPICHTSLQRMEDATDDIFTSSLAALSVSDKQAPGVQCARHPGEELSRFCISCDMLLCSKDTPHHSRCNIDAIPLTMLDKMCKKKQNEVSDWITDTKTEVENACQELLKHQTNNKQTKEEAKQKIKLHFMTLRDDIACSLREQEKKLLDQLELQFDQTSGAEMNKMAWCRSMLEEICNQEELLDRTSRIREHHNKTGVALFQTLTEFELQTAKCKAMVDKYKPSNIDTTVQMNTGKLEEWMQTNTSDCSVVVKQTSANGQCTISDVNEAPKPISDVNEAPKPIPSTEKPTGQAIDKVKRAQSSRHAHDETQTAKNPPFIYATQISYFRSNVSPEEKLGYAVGIGWIDDRLVIVDRWNRKIKLFHYDGSFLECLLFADGEPWDVAVIKDTDACKNTMKTSRYCLVAVPSCRVIIKIMITAQGKMELRARIPTGVGYACISHSQAANTVNAIVCGVCAPFGLPRVDLINMDGRLLRSIAVNHLQHPLFSSPRSVDISEDGLIAVSDWNRNKIVFLRTDSAILGGYDGTKFCKLKESVGTSLDGRGNIFVADKKSESIHMVKLGGEGFGVLQTDTPLKEPREINVSDGPHPRLAVSFGAGFIKVFDLYEQTNEPRATCV